MPLAANTKVLVRPDAKDIPSSVNGYSWLSCMDEALGKVVTISSCGRNVYKVKEYPIYGFSPDWLLTEPYNQDNFKVDWLQEKDEIVLVNGAGGTLARPEKFKENYTNQLGRIDTNLTDHDVYSVTRDGVVIFQRKL